MMVRLGLAVLWALHLLPLGPLARVGNALGSLLFLLARDRRRVALINLALCLPALDDRARRQLAHRHFRALARSLIERGVLWWGTEQRIRSMVSVEGQSHWEAVKDRPVIFLMPHFVGFEMGGFRINLDHPLASMYAKQRNPVLDAAFLRGRTRFKTARMFSRQDGVRTIVRSLREGLPFVYLPDMDFGPRDAVFVPFFGVPAATITGLARLAAISRAAVVPVITRQLPGGAGYAMRFHPAWDDFPSGDDIADVRRMNEFIEARVLEMPEQYYWVHKRFKSRPEGEPDVYGR